MRKNIFILNKGLLLPDNFRVEPDLW